MPIKLYKMDVSPPARAAVMGCHIFNVPVDMVEINLLEKDHLKPEFVKKNPLHTVPTLEDGDLVLHDSHAILIYLAEAYGKGDSWYPKDVKKRALVNQKLFFDTSILFPRLRSITYSVVLEGETIFRPKLLADVEEAYGFMEQFLSQTKYITGDTITIADVSVISNITSLIHIVPLDKETYPRTTAWIKEMEKQSYCQKYNAPGASALAEIIKERIEDNKSK